MPLLHKQKFVRKPLPADLDPAQDVFFSKLTQEIFLDYDEYFERTILCNSLVWTCALSGKTGLTYSEALESEQRVRKAISSFPQALERAILFLVRLTKRGNIKDLVDDLFNYAKDRYFVGETVSVLVGQQINSKNEVLKPAKILDVILPSANGHGTPMDTTSEAFEFNEEAAIDVEAAESGSGPVAQDPSKIKYVIETQLNGSTVQSTVRASQLSRAKNVLTKDKIQIVLKNNCEAASQSVAWEVKENAVARFRLDKIQFSDIFKGEPPQFEQSFGRGLQRNNNINASVTAPSSAPKSSQSSNKLNSSKKSSKKKSLSKSKSAANPRSKSQEGRSRSSKPAKEPKQPVSKSGGKEVLVETEHDLFARKVVQVLNLKVIDMNDEEYELWRDFVPNDDLRELRLIEAEIERTTKREEKEREKERLKQEKSKQKEYLASVKKPKEDLECDNLLELPKAVPVQSKIPQSMFGDSVMILEFLNHFGDLFEIQDDFPNGFNFELLENALFSKSYDSALCNLLLFYLDSIFKCYEEEKFDDSNLDSDDESNDENVVVDLVAANGKADEDDGNEMVFIEQLYNEPLHSSQLDRQTFTSMAEKCSKLIKSIQGRSLKIIGLDVYTVSEMLRLYFLTSGCSHTSKTRFWYQQRGGYTHMDEAGIDFTLNERPILKKLETMTVYELESSDKLKILGNLCHQLMTQVRFRDALEDNWQKMVTLRGQLKDLQVEENRRQREETSERWRKRMQDKAKERAVVKPAKERNSLSNDSSSLSKLPPPPAGHQEESMDEPPPAFNGESRKQTEESNRRRQEFVRKERSLLEEIFQTQAKCSLCSLGRDRYFRRYWIFKSLPGVFVEEEDSIDYNALISATATATGDTSAEKGVKHEQMEVDTEDSKPLDQKTNGKENNPNLDGDGGGSNDDFYAADKAAFQGPKMAAKKEETKWSFYYREEDIEKLIANLNERGLRESELKQNLIDFKDRIYDCIRKSSLFKNLTMSSEDIEKSLRTCLKENISNVLQNSANTANQTVGNKTKRQAAKIAAQSAMLGTNFSTVTPQEYMEMDLRDKVLEIEEQIYVGALGALKVTDRYKWRSALEQSSYDAQTLRLVYGGDLSVTASTRTNIKAPKTEAETGTGQSTSQNGKHPLPSYEATLGVVNDLAKAILQAEQAVERRFLRLPLGESQKTPDRRGGGGKKAAKHGNGGAENEPSDADHDSKWQILHNWEKSLMSCTTLSQLFVHLQSLDESIAWSKSALNARCRLCKRKGDAEKMLLCDGCDRGHHIYCLRPQLNSIPEGEWFCPECKPKSGPKTPRKIRKSFAGNEANSDGEEVDVDDETDDENEEDEDDDDNDEDEEEEVEEDEQEEDDQEDGDEEEDEDQDEEEEEEEEEEETPAPVVVKKGRGRPRKVVVEPESEADEESDQDEDDEGEDNSDQESGDSRDEEETSETEDQEASDKSGSVEDADEDEETEKTSKSRAKPAIKLNGHAASNGAKKKSNVFRSSDDETQEDDSEEESEEIAAPAKRRGRPSKKMKLDEALKEVTTSSRTSTTNGLKSASLTSISTTRSTSSSRVEQKQSPTSSLSRGKVNYSEMTTSDEDHQKNQPRKRGRPPKAGPAVTTPAVELVSISNTNSRNTEMATRLKVIEKLLNDMMKLADAWPFLKPVVKRDAPDYYEVIKKPMDFSTIKNQINHFKYDDYTHIVDDIRLVFENCWQYNEPGSDIYKTGQRMSSYFESHAKQAGLLDSKRLALPNHHHHHHH